jgi:3-dehydroquinate dehydratase II
VALPEPRTIFVLNGPNLDLLGSREPGIYGRGTLGELEQLCRREASALGIELVFRQSNAEHVLVEDIHEASKSAAGLVINPAAFTHYSYSIVDALRACQRPIVEVHLSNLHAREEGWRSKSLISPVVRAVITGMGFEGYVAAIRWIALDAGDGLGGT